MTVTLFYSDGLVTEKTLAANMHLHDWWSTPEYLVGAVRAWSGTNGSSIVGVMYTALVTPLSDHVLEAIEVSVPNGANHVYGLLAATFLK